MAGFLRPRGIDGLRGGAPREQTSGPSLGRSTGPIHRLRGGWTSPGNQALTSALGWRRPPGMRPGKESGADLARAVTGVARRYEIWERVIARGTHPEASPIGVRCAWRRLLATGVEGKSESAAADGLAGSEGLGTSLGGGRRRIRQQTWQRTKDNPARGLRAAPRQGQGRNSARPERQP